jgi:hypothetical protein
MATQHGMLVGYFGEWAFFEIENGELKRTSLQELEGKHRLFVLDTLAAKGWTLVCVECAGNYMMRRTVHTESEIPCGR